MIHQGTATCFATLSDLKEYEKCKAEGMSDAQAFKYGDNGIGCWGDKTAQTYQPMVALHRADMISEFGSVPAAKHQRILVIYKTISIECIVADLLGNPKATIDLNPAAIASLGFDPNDADFEENVTWAKVENATPA